MKVIPFFVEFDKVQAHWVMVAWEADDPNMLAALQSGVDIHAYTASLIYGISIEDVNPDQRQLGKRTNHGLNYDEGDFTFATKALITVAEAKRLRGIYRSVYGGIPRWHQAVQFRLKQLVEGNGTKHYKRTLTNCFGREMRFLGPLSGEGAANTFRQAYSAIPLATEADIVGGAMVRIVDELAGVVTLKSNNHDSLLTQHYFKPSAGRASQVAKLHNEISAIVDYLDPPLHSTFTGKEYRIKTECKAGLRWGSLTKFKPTLAGVTELLERIEKETNAHA